MVSEAATPFFADGMIDLAMDPFDRAISMQADDRHVEGTCGAA